MLGNRKGCRPRRLEIEAARNRVYIQDFPGKIQPRILPGLHCGRVNAAQRHPSRSDKFFLEFRPPDDLRLECAYSRYQTVELAASEL